jgi:hypothetical protein
MKKAPSGGGYGALTTAWIAATSETDTTIISALNTLETDLTTYGLTSKMKALYPMVGGTAAKHKFNFMDARDLDAAFRLTFNGGWTHASTGALPNGTNAYANSYLNASTELTLNNIHLSFYGRTNSTSLSVFVGSFNGTNRCHLLPNSNTVSYNSINTSSVYGGSALTTNGLVLASRLVSTTGISYKNGTSVYSDNTTSDASPNLNIYLSALNLNNAASYYSSVECAMYSIGTGLTPTEAANFYTAVQNFQTTLSRQV